MPKAYSYIRFSSAEQKKGDSYRRQLERSEIYAKEHNLELVTDVEYSFLDEGRSGFKGEHANADGELSRFLNKIKDGSIPPGSYLLIESFDRLSREALNVALPRFIDILNSGVNVVTLMDERVYTKQFNQIDLIYSIMLMSTAHEESAKKADRLGKVWQQKQKLASEQRKPMSKVCPYWLKLEDDGFQTIPERVEVVKEIFNLAINGYGAPVISKQLNNRKVPVFSPTTRNKFGTWGVSSVRKILTSRAVLGEYQPYTNPIGSSKREPSGPPIQNYYPQIISQDLFYLVQAATEQRRTSRVTKVGGEFNVWSKIGVCAKCGAAMNKVNKGTPPKGGIYLVCASARKGTCEYHSLRMSIAESLFKEVLAKVDSLSLVQSNEAKLNKELAIIHAKVSEKEKIISEQIKLLNTYPSNALAVALQQNEAELSVLKAEEKATLEALASDKIISKTDFFQKLNLNDYESRYKANSLLLRLKARVEFDFETSKEPVASTYDLELGDKPSATELTYNKQFDAVIMAYLFIANEKQYKFVAYRNGKINVFAFTTSGGERLLQQNEPNAPQKRGLKPMWLGQD